MKVGDLVNFWSSFEPFSRGYKKRNPGIILSLSRRGGWGSDSVSCTVLWSDESITSEHSVYLSRAEEENKNTL